jgi:type I restriction enzyme M protein
MPGKQFKNPIPTDSVDEKSQSHFGDHYKSKQLTRTSRILRRNATKSEKMLWAALRHRQLGGLKFRRQHPVASSILDFYCHEKRLAIEIDGGYHQHKDVQERDRYRQELTENYVIRFIRFTADEVEENLPEVLKNILSAANKIPLPKGEGRDASL